MGNDKKIKFKYYKGEDFYSDGKVEEKMLEVLESEGDFNNIESNWILKYHLHEDRKNIIEWYDFKKNSRVLEIGAGCGAISRGLLEKKLKLTSVEMSKQRSQINYLRNKDMENFEIVVGNIFDVEIQGKFDYITVIGVLEYIEKYSDYSFEEFFCLLKKYLKPEGKILLAIENRFGLKYFSGAREDHSGIFFEGIEGYLGENVVKTFTKLELIELIESVGFKNYNFYYPFPDYKFAYTIYSDDYLPKVGDIRNIMHNYDQDRIKLFDEERVFDSLVENNMFPEFANSFFVEIF